MFSMLRSFVLTLLAGAALAPAQPTSYPYVVKTIAGTFPLGDGELATSAQLSFVKGLAFDSAGNLYFTDSSRVRVITLDGKIKTIAGNGPSGFSGAFGLATSAALRNPQGVAVDKANNVYIADLSNRRVRKVAADGTISTFAGTGIFGQPQDGAPSGSRLGSPYGLTIDAADNLYLTDISFGVVLKITSGGQMTRVAG